MATVRTNLGRYHGKLLKDCTEFVLWKFCPKLADKIHVNFVGIKNLKKDENISGDCGSTDRDYRGREFEIRLDQKFFRKNADTTAEELVEVIMHELVHVKQCALGEHYSMFHKEYGKIVWKWKGEVFHYETDHIDDDYWEQPWEIEAYGRQYGLMKMFFEKNPHWAEELKIIQ